MTGFLERKRKFKEYQPLRDEGLLRPKHSTSVWLFITASVGLLLFGGLRQSSANAQSAKSQPVAEQLVEGTLNDSLGRPIPDVSVHLETPEGQIQARGT